MVKPMVFCRFSLKPIHWAKRCGHCSWVSQLSQRHGLRHVGLMTIIHWANIAVGCVEQVYPLGSWDNLVEFIGVSVCWIVIWCIIMLYSKFGGHVFLWWSPEMDFAIEMGEIHRSQRIFQAKWLVKVDPDTVWFPHRLVPLLMETEQQHSLEAMATRAIPWSTFFSEFYPRNVAPDVERWWKMWIVWKVKDNSKFWCDFGWKYWLDHGWTTWDVRWVPMTPMNQFALHFSLSSGSSGARSVHLMFLPKQTWK